jgi:hypothetical protein
MDNALVEIVDAVIAEPSRVTSADLSVPVMVAPR